MLEKFSLIFSLFFGPNSTEDETQYLNYPLLFAVKLPTI